MSKPIGSCIKCHKRYNLYRHHIIYPNEEVILCHDCHKEITLLNTVISRLKGCKLDNRTRMKIWNIYVNLNKDEWVQNSILRDSCVGGQVTDEAEQI